MNDSGEIVGMVDVLKLTYATLEQVNQMNTGDSSEGPAWNKFWLSLDNETESMVSGEGSHHQGGTMASRSMVSPDMTRERITSSVAPEDSASHVGGGSPSHSFLAHHAEQAPGDIPFTFKFKAPSGRVHRLQVVASHGIEELVASVATKLGAEVESIGGIPEVEDGTLGGDGGFAMSFLDDEGDTVSITTDQDLLEAILLARHHRRDKVDLFVHHPDKAATAAAPVLPTPPESSAASGIRRRRTAPVDEDEDEDDSDEEDDVATVRRRKRSSASIAAAEPEQLIPGVPNDLLLPGAIVTLAVVIVSVFALGRASSR